MNLISHALDKEHFTRKPEGSEVGRITNRILQSREHISLENFAHEISVNGRTTVLADFVKGEKLSSKSKIVCQSVFMLDFDNTSAPYYQIEDLENDPFMQENAIFYYKTFSHVEGQGNKDKFRVVFRTEKLRTTIESVEDVYQKLFRKYPQADTKVGQTSRLFFGSNYGYTEINFENTLDLPAFGVDIVMSHGEDGEVIDIDTPTYLLLKYKQYSLVKEKLGNNFSGTFSSELSAINFFCEKDMYELLDLPPCNPFLDILHKEENPSASVYFSEEHNVYFYKCFSNNHRFVGDIINVLERYLKVSKSEVIDILIDVTNSKIDRDTVLALTKLNSEIFKQDLVSGKLAKKHPDLYDYLKRYSQEIYLILDFMFDYVYTDSETGEIKYLNYYSLNKLTALLSRNLHKKVSLDKIRNIMNVIAVTEVIQKVPEGLIPRQLYEDLIEPQKTDSKQIRTSSVYQPNNLTDTHYESMQSIAKILKENNVTVSSLSYELVYRLFGEEKANKDFPQAYKPLEEKGLVKMSVIDKKLTERSVALEKSAVKILNKALDEDGYIFEETLVRLLSRSMKSKQTVTTKNYAKIRADICEKYNIKRERMTKETYEKLGVTTKYTTKVVLYREE